MARRERTDTPGIYKRQTRAGVVYDVVVAQGDKRVWKTVSTKDAAKKLRTATQAARDKGVNIAPVAGTVEEFLEEYLTDHVQVHLAPRSHETYHALLHNHVIPMLGKKQLRDLTAEDIRKCYRGIREPKTIERGGKKLHLKAGNPKTILGVHRVLNAALSFGVQNERLPRNVMASVARPKTQKYRIQPPSKAQISDIVARASTTPYKRLVPFAVLTGQRQIEIIGRRIWNASRRCHEPHPEYGLRWADVDLERAVLHVRKAKHDSARTIALSPDAVQLLIEQRAEQTALFSTLRVAPTHDLVFTDEQGEQIGENALRSTWRQIRPSSSIRFHDLRHAHASLLISAGVHPKVIQERLGHKNITTTMDTYGHLMAGMQEDAVRRLDNLLKGD